MTSVAGPQECGPGGRAPGVDHPASVRDIIILRGVRAHGRHGVLPAEKETGHDFLVDARLHLDTPRAGRGDMLSRTVNYAEVAETIVGVISTPAGVPGVDLIETLAERIADGVLAEQPLVRGIDVEIHKPTAPIPHPFADVSVRIHREAAPVPAVLSLGSNLGDRAAHLRRARDLLARSPGVELAWCGPLRETDPVGGVDQGAFLNTVMGVRTTCGPWELLGIAQRLEADAQRERTVRWGPRTLDVDVITWGDLHQEDPLLTLPHPRAHERAFVLEPWAAAEPAAFLRTPAGERTVSDLLREAPDREGVRPAPPAAAEVWG